MKWVGLSGFAIALASFVTSSASAMPAATPDAIGASDSSALPVKIGHGHGWGRRGGRGHHYGWGRGRGHHYGWRHHLRW